LGFTNVGGNGLIINILLIIEGFINQRYKKSKLNATLTEAKQNEKDGFLKIYDCGKLKFERRNYSREKI
jgi:hypothetical protein